jgi:hypothetical protein
LLTNGGRVEQCRSKIKFTNVSNVTISSVDVGGESTFPGLATKIAYSPGARSGYRGSGVAPGESVEFDNSCDVKYVDGEDLSNQQAVDVLKVQSITVKLPRGWLNVSARQEDWLNQEARVYDNLIELAKR